MIGWVLTAPLKVSKRDWILKCRAYINNCGLRYRTIKTHLQRTASHAWCCDHEGILGQKLSPLDINTRARKACTNFRLDTRYSHSHLQVLQLLKHAYESGIPFNAPEDSLDTPEIRSLLRRAASDSIVLLKNDKGLLPLRNKISKIAVIGPNAKHVVFSGGGSASLRPTYTVSPLDGIKKAAQEIGAEVTYSVGVYSYKWLPEIDRLMSYNAKPGALFEFWNDIPAEDFLSTSADVVSQLPPCTWKTLTSTAKCFVADGIVSIAYMFTVNMRTDA